RAAASELAIVASDAVFPNARDAGLRDLRPDAPRRRADDPVLSRRRGLPRGLPALPGDRGRAGLAEGGQPDDADVRGGTTAPTLQSRRLSRSSPGRAGRQPGA